MAAQPQTQQQLRRIKRDLNYLEMKGFRDFKTNEELRRIILKYGLVEHRINPYDALQRAIDDATIDYLLIRKRIDRESDGPSYIFDHELYPRMKEARETMVRYSTYAIQYDIVTRQQKITETRVALLGHALRITLRQLGMTEDDVKRAPGLLIDNLATADRHFDHAKATALVEILHEDSEVEVLPAE